MDDTNIVNLNDVKAKVVGVSPQLLEVINQLNARFDIHIDITDDRLSRFKMLFPVLDQAATVHHELSLSDVDDQTKALFLKGIEIGRAQMMTDVIICILEQDGLIRREQL